MLRVCNTWVFFAELLVRFTGYLRGGCGDWVLDRVLVARAVHVIIRAAAMQHDVRAAELMPLLTHCFTNIRSVGSYFKLGK
jgi:hypothetical protein